ncbi:hypothetical protein RYH80_04170 [Halobaculum sp. MBLA0147]|uniref:hypothetical protein n=1 Tax=Halobaculum sp. MBLA0147 TaxID=3079934 RepID=UPI003523680A
MDRTDTPPLGVAETLDSDATTLVVHAPGVAVAGQFPDDVTEREGLPTEPEGPTAVLDFYDAWQTADPEAREAFRALLNGDVPIHVAATPREFDWLLSEGTLSPDSLTAVSQVVRVRFDPEDDRPAAVNVAMETDGTLDRLTVRSAFGSGGDVDPRYVYEGYGHDAYRCSALGATVRSYDTTLVPRAVETTEPPEPSDGVTGRVVNRLRDASGKAGLSQFYGDAKEVIVGSGATAAGVAAQIPEPVTAGVGLAAYLSFASVGDSTEYSSVFGEQLPANRVAAAEQTLDLPPRTFERLRSFAGETLPEIVDGEVVTRATLESETGSEAELSESVVAELESVVEDHDEDDGLVALDRTVRRVASVVDDRASRALAPLESLAEQLEKDDANVLGRSAGDEDGRRAIGQIPYVPRQDTDDDLPDDRREAAREALDDAPMVVLAGPHGTGKTTVAYQVCESLAAEGYEVRAADLSPSNATAVETALDEIDGDVALYLQYGYGRYGLRGEQAFRELLGFLSRGACDKVVLEVRSEKETEFGEATKLAGQSGYGSLVGQRERVEFERFRHEEPFGRLAALALDAAGFEPENDEEAQATVEWAAELSRGNPEILKIAAQFAARGEHPLDDIDTVDELIWEQVMGTLDLDGPAGRILERLAGFEVLSNAELEQAVSEPRAEAAPLQNYLGGEIRAWLDGDLRPGPEESADELTWTLSPDIYGDVLFRKFVFGDQTERRDRLFERLLEQARDGTDSLFARLAAQTSTVYESATESDDEQLRGAVRDRAETLVEWADECTDEDDVYFLVVRRLLFAGVPLAADSVDAERLVGGAPRDAAEFGINSSTMLKNLCSYFLSNGLKTEGGTIRVTDLGTQIAASGDFDPTGFLGNVYAMALKNLADEYGPDDTCVADWIDTLDSLAHDAATEFNPEVFLENVYAMALRQLADDYDPDDARIADWTDTLDSLAHGAATDFDPEVFLKNVYGMALTNLADEYSPDDDAIPVWIERINEAIQDAAEVLNTNILKFTMESYRVALRHMADKHTIDSVRPWLTRFEAVLHRDNVLATAIRQEYRSFVSVFYEGSLPLQHFEDWIQSFLNLYFRVVDYGVPSLRFRQDARNASGVALLHYTRYSNILYEFDAGRLDQDDFVRYSAGFLNAMSESSNQTAQTVVTLVAHELRHVDADLDTVLPRIRQRLRSEHENGELAGLWRAHFAGEWPTPAVPRSPTR